MSWSVEVFPNLHLPLPRSLAHEIAIRRLPRQAVDNQPEYHYRQIMPSPVFRLAAGELPQTIPEEAEMYQGEASFVPTAVAGILNKAGISIDQFRSADFDGKMLYLRRINDSISAEALDSQDSPQDRTRKIVQNALSMQYRTLHPLAFDKLGKQYSEVFSQMARNGQTNIHAVDIGYGPGAITAKIVELARQQGITLHVFGIETSAIHQSLAQTLWGSDQINFNLGDGTQLANPQINRPLYSWMASQNITQLDTSFANDVGHHLDDKGFKALIHGMLNLTRQTVLTVDPRKLRLSQKAVGLITRGEAVGPEALASYNAARRLRHSLGIAATIYNSRHDITPIEFLDTGFMLIQRIDKTPQVA
jgi:SAM-dependent methyltransferase